MLLNAFVRLVGRATPVKLTLTSAPCLRVEMAAPAQKAASVSFCAAALLVLKVSHARATRMNALLAPVTTEARVSMEALASLVCAGMATSGVHVAWTLTNVSRFRAGMADSVQKRKMKTVERLTVSVGWASAAVLV